jgi:hypothetical protein
MEVLHAVGGIPKKISVNCVIQLHVALLSTCLFYGFIICVVMNVCRFLGIPVYAACLCLFISM